MKKYVTLKCSTCARTDSAGTIVGSPSIGAGAFAVDTLTDVQQTVTWTDADIAPDGANPLTIEGFIEPISLAGSTQVFMIYYPDSSNPANYHRLSWYNAGAQVEYRSASFPSGVLSAPVTGRTHWSVVIGGSIKMGYFAQQFALGNDLFGTEGLGALEIRLRYTVRRLCPQQR